MIVLLWCQVQLLGSGQILSCLESNIIIRRLFFSSFLLLFALISHKNTFYLLSVRITPKHIFLLGPIRSFRTTTYSIIITYKIATFEIKRFREKSYSFTSNIQISSHYFLEIHHKWWLSYVSVNSIPESSIF